ncbi:PAS domain S-box protein [Methanoregula sp.]|uniref:PAS domain S-box protein n=1 Tax=Methanoregula sp. TaxID=2052170 RepID=UPI002C34F78F|nr:PAS domain S-box protein [Methanoregula sp.]HVP95890.1 PAS domain S-box protein [Methanoregula sp.]
MISILYVDDEESLLEVGKLFLERSGQFSVDVIASATEALDLLATREYDAIISDYQMPVMDGIEFLKKVRSSGKTIPFILFSGRGREEIVIQALNEGADFYLQKGGEPLAQFTELSFKVRHAVQKRWAESRLREHERREADIINFLPDPTFAIDKAGTVITWNRAMEEITGIRPAEILGKDRYEHAMAFYHERRPMLADLILSPDARYEEEHYLYTIHGNRVLTAETTFQKPDGTPVHIWGKASLLLDGNGLVAGAIESIRDITEQKKAEKELRAAYDELSAAEQEQRSQFQELARSAQLIQENEENFRQLVETAPDPIYIIAGDRFAYVNPAMVRLMGAASAQELLHTSLFDRIHPSCHGDIHGRARTVIEERRPAGLKETVYIRMDGTPIDIESSIAPFRYHGEPAGLVILRDITRRKRAEQQLKESEEKYRDLVETADNIILKWDKTGTITFANGYAAQFFGYSRDEIVGKPVMGTIVPPTESGSEKDLQQMIADIIRHPERYTTNENENITRDGRRVWIQWHNRPLFDGNGEFAGLFSIGADVTEKRKEKQELFENEQCLTSIYNTVADAIFQLAVEPGGQYRFTSVNRAFSLITGIPPGRVIGKTVEEVIPPESLSFVREKYHKAIETRALVRWEETSMYPSGMLTGEISIAPIFDKDGTCTHLVGSAHDITDRKKSEQALRETEAEYRSIFAAESDGIAVVDQATGTILDCNEALALMHGYGREELLGQPITALSAESDATKLAINQATPSIRDRYHKRKDGSVFPVEITVNATTLKGREVLIGALRDVTGIRRAEEELRQANRSLALLTNVTRHDINNQLVALNGFLELLHEKVKDPSLEMYFAWLSQVSTRIASMIQFASTYETVRKPDLVWQDLHTLVQTAVRQVSLGKIAVKNEIPTGVEIFSDPMLLKVIYNLVENAVRYGGSTLSILRFYLVDRDGHNIIVCEDDGAGVPYENKERIFDRGFGKNTGLGLFLAREILSLTGITIRETGEPGKGARFEIAVPKGSFRFDGKP